MLDAVAAVTTLHTFFGNNAAVIITFDYSYIPQLLGYRAASSFRSTSSISSSSLARYPHNAGYQLVLDFELKTRPFHI